MSAEVSRLAAEVASHLRRTGFGLSRRDEARLRVVCAALGKSAVLPALDLPGLVALADALLEDDPVEAWAQRSTPLEPAPASSQPRQRAVVVPEPVGTPMSAEGVERIRASMRVSPTARYGSAVPGPEPGPLARAEAALPGFRSRVSAALGRGAAAALGFAAGGIVPDSTGPVLVGGGASPAPAPGDPSLCFNPWHQQRRAEQADGASFVVCAECGKRPGCRCPVPDAELPGHASEIWCDRCKERVV